MELKHKVIDADKYKGQWIAFKPGTDEVVGAGTTLKEAKDQAQEKGFDHPEFYHVPKSNAYLAPSSSIIPPQPKGSAGHSKKRQ